MDEKTTATSLTYDSRAVAVKYAGYDLEGNSIIKAYAKKKHTQEPLLSGYNIKTINGESILGPGNLAIALGVSEDELSAVALTGNYNDLTNKPTIPTNISSFINDVGYITDQSLSPYALKTEIPTKISDLANDAGYITGVAWNSVANKPIFASVATSGSYNDLSDTPIIPVALSDLLNDSGYITGVEWNNVGSKPIFATVATSGSYNDLSNKPTLFSGNYNDLTNKPAIPTVPTSISSFNNDSNYITNSTAQIAESQVTNLSNDLQNIREVAAGKKATYVCSDVTNVVLNSQSGSITVSSALTDINSNQISLNTFKIGDDVYIIETDVPDRWVSSIATSGDTVTSVTLSILETAKVPVSDVQVNGSSVISNNIASITMPTDLGDLTNNAGYIKGIDWNSVGNKPTFATVAATGSYNDLSNTPNIPVNTSDLNNNSGFITSSDLPSNHVTTDSFQNITGNKKIKSTLFFGNNDTFNTFLTYNWSNKNELHIRNTNGPIEFRTESILPFSGDATYLGSPTKRWKNGYFSGSLSDGINSVSVSSLNYGYLDYNTTTTYALNSKVKYNDKVYRCSTAITAAEAWDTTHWTEVNLGDMIDTFSNQNITGVKTFNSGCLKFGANSSVLYSNNSILFGFYGNEITMGKTLEPSGSSLEIGRSNHQWKNIFLSGFIGNNNANYGLSLPDTTSFTANKEIATTDNVKQVADQLTDEYDSTRTYALGKLVIHDNVLYKCTTAITTAENWDSAHWTATTINNEMVNISQDQVIKGRKITKTIDFVYNTSNPSSGGKFTISNDNGYNAKIVFNGKGFMFTAGSVYPNDTSTSVDLGQSSYRFRDIYFAGKLSDGTNSINVALLSGVGGKYASLTPTDNTAELPYSSISNMNLSADTTFTLRSAPSNSYPEYKANITNSHTTNTITITLTGVSKIKTNDANITITEGANSTFTLDAETEVELNIQNGHAIVYNWGI